MWLFDAEADAQMIYKAEKIRRRSDNNFNYVERSYYSVKREGAVVFENVPVDGSKKMADELMESIEPFDANGAVDFLTAYLSGYLADKYDVDSESSISRANERIKRSTEDAFRNTVTGYSSVTTIDSSISLHNGRAKYALYPVWILNTQWKDQKYTFIMNGQTGKFAGDLPMDKGAFWRWLLGVAVIGAIVLFVVKYLMWLI